MPAIRNSRKKTRRTGRSVLVTKTVSDITTKGFDSFQKSSDSPSSSTLTTTEFGVPRFILREMSIINYDHIDEDCHCSFINQSVSIVEFESRVNEEIIIFRKESDASVPCAMMKANAENISIPFELISRKTRSSVDTQNNDQEKREFSLDITNDADKIFILVKSPNNTKSSSSHCGGSMRRLFSIPRFVLP